MKNSLVFIVSHGSSASSAVSTICNMSENGMFFSENAPKLCLEARDMYEGRINNPRQIIIDQKSNLVKLQQDTNKIIGDKSANYLLFVESLVELWDAKIIFLIKDPIKVIPTGINASKYNSKIGRGVYFGSAEDLDESKITSKEDWWDYSRFRPKNNEEDQHIFQNWKKMPQLEKASWNWNRYNGILKEKYDLLPNDNKILINTTNLMVEDVERVYDFTKLKGFDRKAIMDKLNSKLNSYASRTDNNKDRFILNDIHKETILKYTKSTAEAFGLNY